jgi:hypothetical protein
VRVGVRVIDRRPLGGKLGVIEGERERERERERVSASERVADHSRAS